MIRSFLPVGQGAFYTEQFDCGMNIVYDCGSSTGKSAVEKQIADTFEPREKIQAVFISHLHEDHINGLPFLLSYCCVEKIYLPFLTEEEILLTRLIAHLENTESTFLADLLEDPLQAVEQYTLPVDTTTPELFSVMPVASNLRNRGNTTAIPSGKALADLKTSRKNWVYVPYNFQNTRRSKAFFRGLKKNGYDKKTLQSYLETSDIFSYDWNDIRKIYQTYAPGSLNSNSLVVYSGPQTRDATMVRPYDARTEDSWKELTDYLSDYMPSVGTVQVPHHGSKHNYNEALSCGQFLLIISAGYQNKYRHPHAKVLKDMLMKKVLHFWVTEQVGSMVQFQIDEEV